MIKETIPLLKDKHNHISIYSALNDCLDIQNIQSKSKVMSLIEEKEEELTIVLGWNTSYYDFSEEEINKLNPLIICDLSLHDVLINETGKEMLKDRYPDLIKNIDNKSWIEKNYSYLMKILVDLKGTTVDKFNSVYDSLLQKGISYAADMLLPNENALMDIKESRIKDNTEIWADIDTYKELNKENRQYIEGIKFFTDGAIGTKTAALKGNYNDDSNGVLIYSDNELKKRLLKIMSLEKPMSIHTIGDEATEQVLDTLEKIKKEEMDLPYIRMEHCQFINKKYAKKAKKLGINLCMQPTFSFDSLYYQDRLPKDYLKNNNPFRMLIDEADFQTGEDLFFGSDGMPHGVYHALKSSLFPPLKSQRLNLEEFIQGYCVNNERKGKIEVEIDREKEEIETEVFIS